MRIVSLPLASRPLLIRGTNSLDLDEEKPAPSLLAKKSPQTPAATPPAARPSAATLPPVAQPSAAQTSAAAAQLATVPTWLKGQPGQPPSSSGAASAPLIPLRPAAPANNAAPKPTAIPLRPAAASAAKTAQQPQPPGAPAPGQQPAPSAQTPAPGPQAAAAPRSAATPPASTPATGQQPRVTQPPAPAAVPPPNSTPPLPAPTAPAGRAAAPAPQPQPRGISANPRGDGAAAVRMQGDIAAGKVIQNGKVVPHPDKSGDLYHAGFTQPTFTDDAKKGTTIPYRDDHGKVHPIGVQDMRRTTDPAGNASYSFQLNGQNISVPEDSKAPLFQIDPQTGRRFTTAADGTRRELGYDRNTAAQAGISPREQARDDAREKLLTQGAALTRQLQDKQAQVATAQQRMDAAQQKYHNPGNATDAERQAHFNELMGAFDAHNALTSEVQTLQKQHDDHYQKLVRDQRARQAEIDHYKAAAAEHPQDEPWRKDSRHTQGDTRQADADLIAAAEKQDPATAAAMRSALGSQPTQRALAAAQSAFGGTTAPGQPAAAPGKTMSLHEMLMHAPEMKQGGWKSVDQAAAARATAQATFGITDPENVHVTPGASGGYSLSRKGADGSPGQPFAIMDGRTGRITLLPGADGRYSPAAQDLAARSTPGSAPVYLGKGTPLTEAERSDLIKKGQQATAAAKDRQGADAALTAAGLSPEGIQKLRNEGRLSVQDAKFFNDKFNSGYSSYAQRDAHETAQKQNAGLLQMYRDTKAPADQPNFKSWMEKGDPQRDAMVQAKAKELGMSEDDVRRAMEDQRRTDFATPLTQQGHDQQSGMLNAIRRGIGFSGHDQDTTRTLTDGSLVVNPALTDDKARFEQAIQDSNASPEAKAAALKTWPAQHDAWLTRATDTLKAGKTLPGVEDYNAWLTKNTLAGHFSQKMPDGSVRQYTDNEKTQIYLDAMKNRSGVRKFMDNVSTSLVAGGGQVVSGLLGAAALAGNTFQDITGVNVGGEAASEAAAGISAQNQGLTSAHELTGTVEGTGSRFISNLIQAVPSVGAAIASGGTAGLILGAAQSAGGTYTDLLQDHIMKGDSIEEAHKKAAGTAIASGALSLALGKFMPGGKQALNNPATKQAFSSTVKSFAKGGAEEISQGAIEEGFTHIASEMNKGKTFNEAATSFAEQFPQSALTSALLGGGIETAADHRQTSDPTPQQLPPQQPAPANPPASAAQQPPSPAAAQQPIPQATTPGAEASGSGQQSQTVANNRQPPQTPSPSGSAQQPQTTGNDNIPSQTPPASGSAQQPQTTANNSKQSQTSPPAPSLPPPTTAPKSPEQSQRLINNVMNRPPEQRGHPQVQSDVAQAQSVLQDHVQKLENQTEPLSDTQKKELADAKATLSRLPAEKPANTPENTQRQESANRPQPQTPDSATRPHGEADPDAQPATSDPNRTTHADTNAEAPRSRSDFDGRTPQADTQPSDARPGRKLPADAEPPPRGNDSSAPPQSARNRPDGRPLEPSHPAPAQDSSAARNTENTTPYHPATSADSANATNPQTADRLPQRNAPDQVQYTPANPSARPTDNSRQPAPNAQGTPPTATANGSQPSSPSRTSLPPPRTPPLSVEQSRRLLDNVAKMPEKARQHPQVLADVAQARDVVSRADARSPENSPSTQSGSSVAASSAGNPSATDTQPHGTKGSVSDEPRLSNATPSHAPAIAKSMPGEGSKTGGKAVEQSHAPHQGQPPVALKVPLSSSAPKLTPQQQANIPQITQTAKTLLAKLTAAHASKFQNLKTPFVESADANPRTQSGMWLNADYSIGYHLPTLAAELATHADHAIPVRIESSFANLLQASPAYDQPTSTSQANKSISSSGTQPGVDAPHPYTKVESGITPHLKEWTRIDGEIQQWKDDLKRMSKTTDMLAMDRIQSRLDVLEEQRQNLIDQAHQFIVVPTGIRIPFPFTDHSPSSRPAAIRGAALAERYIHPDLLPSMGTVDFDDSRAGQFRGMLLINRSSSPSKVLHEIAHGVEEQSQQVLNKCLAFLQSRAGNEKPKKLALLMQDKGYRANEIAYEDEFASRGGSHYMGKIYPDGTEILTMGIERLHADPIEFYMNDPEYFKFVIQTLQHP